MPIDFTFSPDVDEARERIAAFIRDDVESTEKRLTDDHADHGEWRTALHGLRDRARDQRGCGFRTCHRSGAGWVSAQRR